MSGKQQTNTKMEISFVDTPHILLIKYGLAIQYTIRFPDSYSSKAMETGTMGSWGNPGASRVWKGSVCNMCISAAT